MAKAEPVKPKGSRFHLSASTKRMLLAVLVLLVIVVLAFVFSPFWINWLWFGSVGYRSVIVTNYLWDWASFIVGGLIGAFIFVFNVWMALRLSKEGQVQREGRVGRFSQRLIQILAFGVGVLVFLISGARFSDKWIDLQLALRGGDFNVKDPTFNKDVGFYVFRLPILHDLHTFLLQLGLVTAAAVAVVYAIRLGVRFRKWGDAPWVALRHLSILGSLLLIAFGAGYLLSNYDLVLSTRGVVVGPSYTDVNIVRPLNYLMAFLSLAAAVALLIGNVVKNPRWLAGIVGGWAILAFAITPLLPVGVQRFIVDPNEFPREEKYIERNIAMTRAAFGLDQVTTTQVTGQDPIAASSLSSSTPPLSNVRIWDYSVVQPIYQQLQTFVPYYEFHDIDIDTYTIDGQPVQVLIAARELNIGGLPANSQTWTNVHLAYTHGYGSVVSPVSQVSNDGWPTFLVSNIPPTGTGPLAITQPEIYFGEADQDWIIVHTKQSEFTGINDTGEQPTTGYTGLAKGSIPLGNPVTRIMAALTYGDRNIFFSSQLTGDSRLIDDRSVVDRAKKIAPFLQYDDDPYLVIADGRLVWVIDAYTTSDHYPNATKWQGVNYLRNSVKVTVDAYDGTTTFYRTGETDPIADAWGKIYGDLFTPVSEAPAAVTEHFRYPERQFLAQSDIWSTYHVDTARSLYDGDDRWAVAQENIDNQSVPVEPYFVTLPLPGETDDVFALTVPFTPSGNQNRQNMTAWFAGTADATGKTTLRLYRYPRQITVFGPQQIEARINQDPDISQQLSLWSRGGSDIIRGNLLVIPINDALLYVQPVYLQATSSGAGAPQLAAVILATKDKVVMRPSLDEAIKALGDPSADSVGTITETPATPTTSAAGTPTPSTSTASTNDQALAEQALQAFNDAEIARQKGDWAAYGEAQERLGTILTQMAGGGGTPVASPVASPTASPEATATPGN
ncbi:MAG: UPF0182 family protein [Thermomicrobiales bacterium]